MPTTNKPTTTTTIEEDTDTTTETSTTDNTDKAPTGSLLQGTTGTTSTAATTGIIAGVAIGGILTGAVITVLVTLIIVLVIAKLTRKKESTLSLLAMNRLSSEEADTIKDVGAEMKKDVEEPVYSVVLPNPVAGSDHQVDNMKKNECYGTLRA
jgi:hypothetical protein